MGCLVALGLLAIPIVEIIVIVKVGAQIGAVPTVILLLVISFLGAALVRRQGARTWAALRDSRADGRLPTREVTDGILVMLGGVLLLVPGFVTDAVGLFLIFPLTRPLARRLLGAAVGRRFVVVRSARIPWSARGPGRGGYGDVIEGEVVEQPSDDDPGPDTDRPGQIGRAD